MFIFPMIFNIINTVVSTTLLTHPQHLKRTRRKRTKEKHIHTKVQTQNGSQR